MFNLSSSWKAGNECNLQPGDPVLYGEPGSTHILENLLTYPRPFSPKTLCESLCVPGAQEARRGCLIPKTLGITSRP